MIKLNNMKHIFHPFRPVNGFSYVLYELENGDKTPSRPETDDFRAWRVSKCDNDCWSITLHEEYSVSDLYVGKIPTRQFFVELMKNVMKGFDVENY